MQFLLSIYNIYTVSTQYLHSIYTVSGGNVAHFLHTTSCLHTADTRDWGISASPQLLLLLLCIAVLHLL